MGNPLYSTLANILMCKLEGEVVTPHNLPFYERYLDDCFTKRKTNAPDNLLEKLNSYHPDIKFTMEENRDHLLDTSDNHQEGNFTTRVYLKPGKLHASTLEISYPSQKGGSATLFQVPYIEQNK